MASRKSAPADDIIDLTELIEKGGAESGPRKVEAHVEHDDADIEALLADMDAGDSAPPKPAARVDADERLDMSGMGDLDDLLNDLDMPPQPVAPPADDFSPPSQGSGAASFADDLDALLDQPAAGAQGGAAKDDLDALYARLDEPPAAAQAAPNPVDSDLDDILSSLEEPAAPAGGTKQEAPAALPDELPDELPDALLDDLLTGTDAPQAQPRKAQTPQHAPAQAGEIAHAAETGAAKLAAEAARAETELAAAAHTLSPENASGALSANIENLNFQARDFGTRLQNCEADLAQTRLRMEGLEKSAANSASIEDLLRDGSPLHTGFAALISASVGQVIQDTKAAGPDPQTLNKLHQLEIGGKGAQSRLDALESRLGELEKLTQAAGQAAEKMGALIQDGDAAAMRMDAVEKRLEAMLPQIEKASQLADHYDELLHVSARLGALENSLGDLSARLDAAGAAGDIAAQLTQEISSLGDKLALQQEKLDSLADLEARLAEIAESGEALAGRQTAQDERAEELAGKIAALAEQAENGAREDGTAERLAQAETKAAQALEKAAELARQIAAIDVEGAAAGVAQDAAQAAAAPLEAALRELSESTAARFGESQEKLDALAGQREELFGKTADDIEAKIAPLLEEAREAGKRLESVESAVAALRDSDALAPLARRLDEIEKRAAEEAAQNAAALEEFTQKIDEIGNAADIGEKLAKIESDAQSAKIRVLAVEDKLADPGPKEALKALESAVSALDEFARSGQAALDAKIGELAAKQAETLKNGEEIAALAAESRRAGERLAAAEKSLAALDLEQALEPIKSDVTALAGESKKLERQEKALAAHESSLNELAEKIGDLSAELGRHSELGARLEGLEADARAVAPKIQALEGRLDAAPAIENVEAALLAKIGGVEQEARTARENLDVLENRLGELEAKKDVEDDIDARLAALSGENAARGERLAALEGAVERLEEKAAAGKELSDLRESLSGRLGDFEKKLSVLEEIAARTADIAAQLQGLDKSVRSVAYRMDAVETRLDNLEPRFNKEVEKAAAGAVSRILREEISRLMGDE